MAGFSELVKSFDKTRDYIRDFFIYGYKVRTEFNKKSSRTYDNEKRRVESWLDGFLRYDNSSRGKQVSISVDSGKIPENPLYKAFYSKSFTDNDIRLHFLLTDILAGGEAYSLKEINNILTDKYAAFFDEQTVRNKLKEYVSEGLFMIEKRGKTDYFYLSPDTADSFFGEFEGLDDAVRFFSEASEFGIAGNSILKTAGITNDIFFIKHNYIVHTLEDEVLLDITRAIESEQMISFVNFGSRGGENTKTGVPLKIFSSAQTGRRYLIMYDIDFSSLSSYRLDFIKSVRCLGKCGDYERYRQLYSERENNCFGVSFGGGCTEKFSFVISADENTEKYIIERAEREKRCCTVEKTGDGLYTVTAEIFDSNEMMTWVKSFIGRIVSISGTNDSVTEKLYDDIRRMYSLYEKEEPVS